VAAESLEQVAVDGATLWTASSGAGLPLVLCHGGPGLCDNLSGLAQMVDDLALVHRYDQRGGGGSSTEGPFDAATFVADLEALRVHWSHERWIVGGHSWGASLALRYALAYPRRTLGVIYLAGPGLEFGRYARERGLARNARLTDEERADLSRLMARAADGGVDERFDRLVWLTDFADRATAFRVLDEGPLYACRRNEAVVSAIRESAADEDPEAPAAALRELEAPVLVIHGVHDVPEQVRPIAELAPRGRMRELARSAHLPWLEEPAAVRVALRRFVSEVAAAG
jgi:proline iminopeptidase